MKIAHVVLLIVITSKIGIPLTIEILFMFSDHSEPKSGLHLDKQLNKLNGTRKHRLFDLFKAGTQVYLTEMNADS